MKLNEMSEIEKQASPLGIAANTALLGLLGLGGYGIYRGAKSTADLYSDGGYTEDEDPTDYWENIKADSSDGASYGALVGGGLGTAGGALVGASSGAALPAAGIGGVAGGGLGGILGGALGGLHGLSESAIHDIIGGYNKTSDWVSENYDKAKDYLGNIHDIASRGTGGIKNEIK